MARNTLLDLNNHLFEQIEKLNDDELSGDALKTEVERARAMADISKQIISTGALMLSAEKFKSEGGNAPEMLLSTKRESKLKGLIENNQGLVC